MTNITDPIAKYLAENPEGIKLIVEQTSTTNTWQYAITLIFGAVGSIFVFWMLYHTISQSVMTEFSKVKLKNFARRSKRNMIVIKHTESSMFNEAMINQKTLLKFISALQKFDGADFDLILHTPGGTVFHSEFISRMIKNYPGKVRVFVLQYAMSGGTLLALSGDDIYLGKNACLGPVDPQLGNLWKFGSSRTWNEILRIKGKKAEDQSISFAHMGRQYTKSLRTIIDNLLSNKLNKKQSKTFSKFLTSGEIEHGKHLVKEDLEKYGLKIKDIDEQFTLLLDKIISSPGLEGVHIVQVKK